MARLFRISYLKGASNELDDVAYSVPNRRMSYYWITLFVLSLGITVVVGWLMLARIPVTIQANGIIMPLGGIRELSSLGAGLVKEQVVETGSKFKVGDVVLKMSAPTSTAAYQQSYNMYRSSAEFVHEQLAASHEEYEKRRSQLLEQVETNNRTIARLERIKSNYATALQSKEAAIGEILASQEVASKAVEQMFSERLQHTEQLKSKNLISQQAYIDFALRRTQAISSTVNVIELREQIKIDRERAQRELSDISEKIDNQKSDLLGIEVNLDKLLSTRKQETFQANQTLIEQANELVNTERSLWLSENVMAPYDGVVVALKVRPGEQLDSGDKIGLVSLTEQSRALMLLMSPAASTGSLTLELGQSRVPLRYSSSPESFSREISKSLVELFPNQSFVVTEKGNRFIIASKDAKDIGRIDELRIADSDIRDINSVPVFASIMGIGDDWRDRELTMIAQLRKEDGRRVQQGQEVYIQPNYENSFIGGEISGRVARVGKYLTTPFETEALVGSAQLPEELSRGSRSSVFTAIIELDRADSGDLIVKGPPLTRPLTPGVLASAKITLEARSPMGIIVPFYADLFGN